MPPVINNPQPRVPLVIGHRGASGYLPEHTLASYALAIEMGADYVEPDLVMTKDGVLVARHENEIGSTTDVATRHEFASYRTTKLVDGVSTTGWFTEDFTLAELKTLRAIERLPQLRPANSRFDGDFRIPTLMEVLDLVRATNERFRSAAERNGGIDSRIVGIYPETKHPSYFASIGLPMEKTLVDQLHSAGFAEPHSPVFIQSFETDKLKLLDRMTPLPLVQLIELEGRPYDFTLSGDPRTYLDLTAPECLAEIAGYADAIGVHKALMFPTDHEGRIMEQTPLIRHAHQVGLHVHGWTFRAENTFLPANFRGKTPDDPAAFGDLLGEICTFLTAGMDGFFTDMPDLGVKARDRFLATR